MDLAFPVAAKAGLVEVTKGSPATKLTAISVSSPVIGDYTVTALQMGIVVQTNCVN